ncbi:MAG: putative sulfate exporter family transporter [Nitrososphaerota archaeon]|nr:putative sulfate exporter family transporter [Nitrososphaerota archaeon]MDG6967631.1 putative sulfate exporter family transporter [Nitrososphaerota archaeon]MDG6979340.1 putative sulfate exporter family transporter [Nitrososphaerota archaeon]MDG7006397.1 putative sulfate exporter family transporter [Nitrososphaerota archaeon]
MQILPSRSELVEAAPGLLLVILPLGAVSELAYWLEGRYVEAAFHVPPPVIALMIAAVLGIVVANVAELPANLVPGLQFSTRWLLRIGIVLYGLNFSYALWFRAGSLTILVVGLAAVLLPLAVGYAAGKLLHLGDDASILVAVGTAVCGISAIVATQESIKAKFEEAGMSIATILVFGTFVLFAYPVLEGVLHLGQVAYGVWTGATTLDLPQLVAAALQGGGSTSLTAGLWVKSIRIGLLVPVILVMVSLSSAGRSGSPSRRYAQALKAFPLFILAFFGAILLNTFVPIPAVVTSPLASGSGQPLGLSIASAFLTAAIIAICLNVKRSVLGRTGWKYVLLGAIAWGAQSLLVLLLVAYLPLPSL